MLSWMWICVTETVLQFSAIKPECVFVGVLRELLQSSANMSLSWSRQIPRPSRLGQYGQIKPTFSCCLFAVFFFCIFRHLGTLFLAEPTEWPFTLCKSHLGPLLSRMFYFWALFALPGGCWELWEECDSTLRTRPCAIMAWVTHEACVQSPRGSHSHHEPGFAKPSFWLGWMWQILKQGIKCRGRFLSCCCFSPKYNANPSNGAGWSVSLLRCASARIAQLLGAGHVSFSVHKLSRGTEPK